MRTINATAEKKSKWLTVEEDGKLYLYAADIVEREKRSERERTLGYSSLWNQKESARALTKAEALRLAATLLNWATRR